MRILFDSKQLIYKDPFGTLVPDQTCTLNIHIPSSVQATAVTCIVTHEDGSEAFSFPLTYKIKKGAYEIFQGKFSFSQTLRQKHGSISSLQKINGIYSCQI